MFGRMARLPVDINIDESENLEDKVKEFMEMDEPSTKESECVRQDMEILIKNNIKKAQAKQKKYYDRLHNVGACFEVGSAVLMKDFRRKKRKGGKLDYRWIGPYKITKSLGKGLFRLQEKATDKVGI